jgi:hypothetical protein
MVPDLRNGTYPVKCLYEAEEFDQDRCLDLVMSPQLHAIAFSKSFDREYPS